jgi:hypothetical protein
MMTTTLGTTVRAPGAAPPDGCPSALTALAYADDVTALSTTPEAATYNRCMAHHGDLWRLQCCEECLHHLWAQTCGPAAGWQWRGRELQNVDSVKALGIYLRLTARGPNIRICRWQVNRAYHTWKTVLLRPECLQQHELHIVNTFVKPVACYGMEVWHGLGPGKTHCSDGGLTGAHAATSPGATAREGTCAARPCCCKRTQVSEPCG